MKRHCREERPKAHCVTSASMAWQTKSVIDYRLYIIDDRFLYKILWEAKHYATADLWLSVCVCPHVWKSIISGYDNMIIWHTILINMAEAENTAKTLQISDICSIYTILFFITELWGLIVLLSKQKKATSFAHIISLYSEAFNIAMAILCPDCTVNQWDFGTAIEYNMYNFVFFNENIIKIMLYK